jgi:hypothetical protein
MNFDWSHYLDLAIELYEQAESSGHCDANWRSSISRAYYATYHLSCQLLKDKWGILLPASVSAHGQIVDELCKKRQYSIAWKLARLRVDRNIADYKDTFADLETIVKKDIKRAKRIASVLNRI